MCDDGGVRRGRCCSGVVVGVYVSGFGPLGGGCSLCVSVVLMWVCVCFWVCVVGLFVCGCGGVFAGWLGMTTWLYGWP